MGDSSLRCCRFIVRRIFVVAVYFLLLPGCSLHDQAWMFDTSTVASAPWRTWWAYMIYATVTLILFYRLMQLSLRKPGKDAETRFYRRLQYYVESLDEIPECILNADSKERLLFANHAAWSVLDKSPTEVIGHPLFKILFQRETDELAAREELDSDGFYQGEVEYAPPDGEEKVLDVHIAAVEDSAEDNVSLVVVVRDVTAGIREQRALEDQSKDLEQQISRSDSIRRQLEAKLNEKNRLLEEAHGRVHEHLQLLISFLSIQVESSTDQPYLQFMEDNRQRMKTIALAHESLLSSREPGEVSMKWYLDVLTTGLHRQFVRDGVNLAFERDLEEIYLNINQAVLCGLIINELLAILLQRNLADKAGVRHVSLLMKQLAGEVMLLVSDDGGEPPDEPGMGGDSAASMEMLAILTEQLGGSLNLVDGHGTAFEVKFNVSQSMRNTNE